MSLPSPTELREARRRRVAAMLDAQLYLPILVERLCRGFIAADEATACRWAGWMASLQDDPAWQVIEPALPIREAWPEVWERARSAGFSPATEHHQAIFFTRLFERATKASRYELARQSFRRALDSWGALADTDYLRSEVLAKTSPDLSRDQSVTAIEGLLEPTLALLRQRAADALRIHAWEQSPRRRPLYFAKELVDEALSRFDADSPSPLTRGIAHNALEIRQSLTGSVTEEVDQRLQSIDLATAELGELLAIFDGALNRCRHLGFPGDVDRFLLRRGLAVIWDLRETERDDEMGVIPPMVERLEPCAERLRAGDEAEFFGLQGAIADLQVFKGEEALSLDARQEAFEEALQICAGHRNASRLLSFLLLERANRDLLKIAAIPSATRRVHVLRDRIRPLLTRADEAIQRAEELYPDNDLIDRYRDDLIEERQRFELTVETDGDH